MNGQTANRLQGRAIGATFFAAFGALWLVLALIARGSLNATTASAVLLVMAVLLLAARSLYRAARRFPSEPDDPAVGRAFAWINGIQWTAISIVAFSFARLHIDAYVLSAIAAIVGLHMFPLAHLFRYPLHYATGALLVIWAAASVIAYPTQNMQGVAALGTGAILWLSAAAGLMLGLSSVRQPSGVLTR
jgi:hypothetical protein